jgi:hypothetical protein
MVAFYVCFRATAEETVNAAVLRSIGHVLGALLSWGTNTWFTSDEGRFGAHMVVTIVCIWLIPPPFVYHSKFTFVWDTWLGEAGILEGLLTTYHLTSVLVKSTPIALATQSRALSQCIGAATAAVVSVLILPLYASSATKKKVREKDILPPGCLGGGTAVGPPETQESLRRHVEELLQTRRDWNNALESKGWFVSLLQACSTKKGDEEWTDGKVGDTLSRKVIAAFAVESIIRHSSKLSSIPEGLQAYLEANEVEDVNRLFVMAWREGQENGTNKDGGDEEDLAICVVLSKLLCKAHRRDFDSANLG